MRSVRRKHGWIATGSELWKGNRDLFAFHEVNTVRQASRIHEPKRNCNGRQYSLVSRGFCPNRLLRIDHTGGGGRIRTHGTRKGTTVFKTAAIDHSATPPQTLCVTTLPHRKHLVLLDFPDFLLLCARRPTRCEASVASASFSCSFVWEQKVEAETDAIHFILRRV